MKKSLVILFTCLLCLGLSSCGESDAFIGVWEGKRASTVVPDASMTILAQIKRPSKENKYYVKTVMMSERIPTNPVLHNVLVLSDVTAQMEDGRLRFEDNSTAEIDPETGMLHMAGEVYRKTDYDIEFTKNY